MSLNSKNSTRRNATYREAELAGVAEVAGVVAGVVALVAGVLAEVTELPGAVLEAAEETDAELELALEDAPADELLVLFKQLVSARCDNQKDAINIRDKLPIARIMTYDHC